MPQSRTPQPGAAPGVREQKKVETRAALRTAAMELSRDLGPDAVTVDAISARAGVSPRTFFNYFASKEEAFVGWSEADNAWLIERILARPEAEDPLAAVAAVLGDLVGEAIHGPLWHAQLELLRLHPQLAAQLMPATQRMETATTHGVAARSGLSTTDPRVLVLAAAAVAALRVTLHRWLDSPEGTDGAALLAEAFALLRSGLPTT